MASPMPATMALNQRLGGTNFLSVDGVMFLLGDDFAWAPSTPTRETKKGQSGVYGYSENPDAGYMKGSAFDYLGNSVTSIGNITNSTLVANLASGKTVMLSGGWNVEKPEVSGSEGKLSFNIQSGSCLEI